MERYLMVFLILVTVLLVLCVYGKRAVEKFTNYFEGGEISSQLAGVELSPAIQQQNQDFKDIKASLNQYVKKDEPANIGTKALTADRAVAQEVNVAGNVAFQKGLEVAGTTTVTGGTIPSDIRFIGGDLHDSGIRVSNDGDMRVYVEDLPGNDIGMYFKTAAKGDIDAFVARKNGERFLIKAGEIGAEGIRIADRFELRDRDGWMNIDGGTVTAGKLTTGGHADVEGAFQTMGLSAEGNLRGSGDLNAGNVKVDKELCVGKTCLLEDIWAHLQLPRPGPPGPVGPQGRAGPGGETGARGVHGDTGPEGPRGFEGPRGPQGPKGDTGPEGVKGPKGPLGPIGPIGPIGDNGPQGPTGDQGRGAIGIKAVTNTGVEFHVELTDGSIVKVPANSLTGNMIKGMNVNGANITYTRHDNTTSLPLAFPQITIPPTAKIQGFVGAPGPKGKQGVQGPEGPIGGRGSEGRSVEWVRSTPGRLIITEDGELREVMFPNPLTAKYATNLSMDGDNMFVTWSTGDRQLVTHFPR